jgi:hypothetical protein
MSEEKPSPDLFDLKMLPAWASESPNENRYADFAGEEMDQRGPRDRRGGGGERHNRGPRPPRRNEPRRETRDGRERDRRSSPQGRPAELSRVREEPTYAPPPVVDVRFLPDPRALENVLAQIKGSHLAYSVFSLARMFLEKPERYDVRLKAKEKALFQMGESGAVATERSVLENGAFARELENFYRTEVTQSDPIKGNFTSVARDRVSGALLGPTNHHAYQQKLRALYEQRYSRRMSFPDFQRQIEIVNDPEVVERWKEEARNVTTYTTTKEEPPQTFTSAAETERHFRLNHLAGLLRENAEMTVDGVVSRRLPDRALGRLIENAWAQEFRSPSKMMQELISAFPASGLHIFRHRKGMLFVAPVRPRPISHGSASLSPSINAVLRVLTEAPGVSRKHLLEKMSPAENAGTAQPDDVEKRKLTIASDLRWLVSEGYVIEFNDGTLDLARAKAPAPAPKEKPGAPKERGGRRDGGEKTAAPEQPAATETAPNEQIGELPSMAEEAPGEPTASAAASGAAPAEAASDEVSLGTPPNEVPSDPATPNDSAPRVDSPVESNEPQLPEA